MSNLLAREIPEDPEPTEAGRGGEGKVLRGFISPLGAERVGREPFHTPWVVGDAKEVTVLSSRAGIFQPLAWKARGCNGSD